MKSFRFLFACLLLPFTACQVEDISPELSQEEITEVVESALVAETEGLSVQVEDAADLLATFLQACNQSGDSSWARSKNTGARTYFYQFEWDWNLSCNQAGIPAAFSLNYDTQGQYDTPRMSSTDSATGNFTLTDLQPSSSTLSYAGTYSRQGSQLSKIGQQGSFSSQLDLSTQNLVVDKQSHEILSGTATFTLSGTHSNGSSFSHNGQLVFNGNGMATLTLNGISYQIQL